MIALMVQLGGIDSQAFLLGRVIPAIKEPTRPLRAAVEALRDFARIQFEGGGSPIRWAPLKPSTIKARQRGYGIYKRPHVGGLSDPLHWSGDLKLSAMGLGPKGITKVGVEDGLPANQALIGSLDKVLFYHVMGLVRGVPEREVYPAPEADDAATDAFEDRLGEVLEES